MLKINSIEILFNYFSLVRNLASQKIPYTLYGVFSFEFFQNFFINHIIQLKVFCSSFAQITKNKIRSVFF